jgi:hypothetical protein
MKTIAIVIVFGFACLTASGLQAEIYSWTDENGVKHYSNTPPADRAVQIKTAREIRPSPEVFQNKEKIDEENFEAILEEQDKANKPSAPTISTTQQKPSRQERIQIDMRNWKKNWPISKISRRMLSQIPAAGMWSSGSINTAYKSYCRIRMVISTNTVLNERYAEYHVPPKCFKSRVVYFSSVEFLN